MALRKKWIAVLTLGIFLSLSSCSTNTTPALRGVVTLTEITYSALDTIEELAENLQSPDARLAIKAKISEQRLKAKTVSRALIELLEKYGEINYSEFMKKAFDLYLNYQNEGN